MKKSDSREKLLVSMSELVETIQEVQNSTLQFLDENPDLDARAKDTILLQADITQTLIGLVVKLNEIDMIKTDALLGLINESR